MILGFSWVRCCSWLPPFFYITFCLLLSACDHSQGNSAPDINPQVTQDARHTPSWTTHLLTQTQAQWQASVEAANLLAIRVTELLDQPNAATLASAQQAWRKAYSAYLTTRLVSYFPVQDPEDWHQRELDLAQLTLLIDAWPIEAGYVDSIAGYPTTGIVNDLSLAITAENLIEQHGFADLGSASLGFHVVEFLLWSEHGQRSPDDFIGRDNTAPTAEANTGEADSPPSTRQNHKRRRAYLKLACQQLVEHLSRLQRRWQSPQGHYAQQLLSQPAQQINQSLLFAAQQLLLNELLEGRLVTDSSPYSQSHLADVTAVLTGLEQAFSRSPDALSPDSLSKDAEFELLDNWFNEPADQTLKHHWNVQWQETIQALNTLISVSNQGIRVEADVEQPLQAALVELLILIDQFAQHLRLEVPRPDEYSDNGSASR